MKYLLPILLLLASPAFSQEDMPHPKTGEAGAWIPRWLQKDHLQLEVNLDACRLINEKQKKTLELRALENDNLGAALRAEKHATAATADVLATTSQELQEERARSRALGSWLLGTSLVATAATTVLVLVLVLK